MKYFFNLCLIIICFSVKAQTKDTLVAKFNGICLISGGSIAVADYKNLQSLCPPNLAKVIRFKRLKYGKGQSRKNGYPTMFEGNVENLSVFPEVKPGDTVVIYEIIGLGPNQKRANAADMVLTIK